MSYGFPACTRLSLLNRPQGCFSEPSAQPLRSAPSGLSPTVPMDHPKGTSPLPDSLWNSSLRIRDFSPSPCCAQSYRNILTFLSLELHGLDPFFCHVHETLQVRSLAIRQSKLLRASQLSAHSRRLSSLPHHLHGSSIPRSRLHARCSHVLRAFPNTAAVLELSQPSTTTLQPSRSPREQLHRSVSPPLRLHLHPPWQHSPLRTRRSPCRKLRSATVSHPLVKNQPNHFPPPKPIHQGAGILGPMPLHSHPKRAPPTPLESETNHLLSHSEVPRSPRGHFPPPTSPSPSRTIRSVRRSVHVHPGCENSQNLRSSRFRENSLKQTPVRVGLIPSLGQPSDVRSLKLSRSSKRRLRLLPVPTQQVPSLPLPAPPSYSGKDSSILGPHPSAAQSPHSRDSPPSPVRFPPSFLCDSRQSRPIVFGSFPSSPPSGRALHQLPVFPQIFPSLHPQGSQPLQPSMPQASSSSSALSQITTSVALVENHSPSEFNRPLSCRVPPLYQSPVPAISSRWVQCPPSSFRLQSGVVVGNLFCPTAHSISPTPPQSPRSLSGDPDDCTPFSSCPSSPTNSTSSGYTTFSTVSPSHWFCRSPSSSRPNSPSSNPNSSTNLRTPNGLSFSFFH
nr:movement protein [Scrophularia mottle virus]